jgi:hypothetical protein
MLGFLEVDDETFGVEAEEELDLVLECHVDDNDEDIEGLLWGLDVAGLVLWETLGFALPVTMINVLGQVL